MRRRTEGRKLTAEEAAVERHRRRQRLVGLFRGQALVLVLIGLIVFFALKSHYFFNTNNLLAIGGTASVLGLMALTQTFLMVSGGIDISIGSVAAMTGVILGVAYSYGINIWVSALIAIIAAVGIGSLNGTLAVLVNVDPLVTTLGTYSVFLGASYLFSGSTTLAINSNSFAYLGTGEIARIPFALVLFIVLLAVGLFIERMTTAGRSVYAIGGNLEAARLSGIRINRVRFVLYALSSLSAGVAGVVLASQLSASSPDIGSTYLLSVITAVILGGASLRGGRGSLVGTLVAVAILGVLQNGFSLLSVSSYAQTMVLGILLIAAVLLDQTTRRARR